jgi:1-hydroxycarotenoid 3,4-desaturase
MRAAVIGAGVGGLFAAIRLAEAGADVTVFESAGAVGGKMRTVDGIDAGPTVLTMPWVFEGLIGRYFEVETLDVIARHVWSGGATLDLFTSREKSAEAIASFAGPKERDGFLRFSAYAERIFEESRSSFLDAQKPTMASLLRESGLSAIARTKAIDPFRTMHKALRDFFRDPRLVQLFGRYATYAGSSPYEAPATLCSIAHVESLGVMRVRGGMYELARGLQRRAEELGVTIVLDTRVESFTGRSVMTTSGEHACDVAIMNGEPHTLRECGLAAPRKRSLSAVTWCTDEIPETLEHHNVFFSDDYDREFRDLETRIPDDPTVYVCRQERGLLVLVNAPAGAEVSERCLNATLTRLKACGIRLSLDKATMTAPADFARLFPGSAGALYGAASHGWKAFFDRPGARTTTRGLYLAGGSTHPGAGVPMVAISGQLAAQAAIADFGSMLTSRRTGTPGGTSTQRATMARTR